jgi:RNA polymerase sigma factor (sigma-70 family)
MTRARRERLITDNMPLAYKVAKQVARRFSPRLDIEDFEQDGMLGLCEAAKRCTSVATFPRFAYFRVRGSMVDSHRRKAYREEQNPSREGILALAGLGAEMELAGGLSAANEGDGPAQALEEAQSGIFGAVWQLPVREQRIIELRYIAGLSVQEIGRRLKLSATQIRMLHADALATLKPAAEAMR